MGGKVRMSVSVIYRPTTWSYIATLLLITTTLTIISLSSIQIFTEGLMMSPQIAIMAFYISLLGSAMNIPLKYIKTREYGLYYQEINIFGIRWFLPSIGLRERKTLIAINLGGAIIPLTISIYILTQLPPTVNVYMKIALATTIISIAVNRLSRIIPGFGIAVPGFIPPLITALTSIAISIIPPKCNPAFIAYISGTLGTLIGADLMNINRIPELGASMVSIGGAGTFDGIYLTGIVAVALTLMLI
jgi:uncharacterized membrane protein